MIISPSNVELVYEVVILLVEIQIFFGIAVFGQ